MSGFPGNQGNYHQQHFNFNDGNAQGHYSSQQYSWSSSQQGAPAQSPLAVTPQPRPQFQYPVMQQLQPAPDLEQYHQHHAALHRASMQLGLHMQQDTLDAMLAGMDTLAPFQQPGLMQPPPQPQTQYVQAQPQLPYSQPTPSLPPPHPMEQFEVAAPPINGERERTDERRRELIKEAKKLESRLRRLEESQAHSREQQEVKDRELAVSRMKEHQLHQQLLEAEQRHSRALADMAQSQTPTQQQKRPAFDMSALQKVIAEVQSDRISKNDIKQLVEDAVRNQLSGVAKTSDIDSAASRMEKGLNRIPDNASLGNIQQLVQHELEKAVQKVAAHMHAQLQALDGPDRLAIPAWQPQAPRFETQSYIEEYPDQRSEVHSRASSSKTRQRSLPAPSEVQQANPSESALSRLSPEASGETGSSKNRQSMSRVSVAPSANNALTKGKHQEDRQSKGSRMFVTSVQPSVHNAMIRPGTTYMERHGSSAQAMAAAQAQGIHPSHYGGHQAFAGLPDDFPDNASQVTAWERRQTSRQARNDEGTVVKVRPKNDRRGDVGQTPLRQIGAIPEEDEEGMALVKQSKDVSRSRR